ncbi:MAG TPA: hypothetical protein VK633_09425, partial [Verrucomicrobiae bacterium]|nr:hypothetical protein [Verrucomicrobiae bacterium]
NSAGANQGIRSLWASKAGFDGRPADQPGHIDDYWEFFQNENVYSYESTATDPYQVAGRPEHEPDCLGDFMGASQNKWQNLDSECTGNIDAFSFNFWDKQGGLRMNFTPPLADGTPIRDVQSGLKNWTYSRGYDADVGSQLADFNSAVPTGGGFSFEDLKAEITRGYPVMLILQNPGDFSRNLRGMPRGNPLIHAMVAYQFAVTDEGDQLVHYRTSWGNSVGSDSWAVWKPEVWAAEMQLRGVVLFHPKPKLTRLERANGKIKISWDGPASTLYDSVNDLETAAHSYIVERAASLGGQFTAVNEATTARELTVEDTGAEHQFFRIRLLTTAFDGSGGL